MKPFYTIFGIRLASYGSLIALGIIVASLVYWYRKKDYPGDKETIFYSIVYGMVGGFIGAKLLYLITDFNFVVESFKNSPDTLTTLKNILAGGYVFYGGIIGALIAIYFYAKKYNMSYLDIVDETIDYMVINKEKNILVHETKNNQGNTLYNALINLFQSRGLKRRVRLVNRLDMNTTGLMVVAKNPFAHYNLMQQMEDGSFRKKYHAVVDGSFPYDEIVVEKNIKTDENDHIKKMICDDGDGDYAKTIFKKVISGEKYSIVEAELITGRTHQIRLHLAYLGFPIVGDTLYNDKIYEGVDRQLLHSFEISFKDPRTNEERHYEVSDHADIINFSKKLSNFLAF